MLHSHIRRQTQLKKLPLQPDSEPRSLITRTEALEALQRYFIQTAPSTGTPQDTAPRIDSITNRMWEFNMKRKQLEERLGT